MLKKLCTCFTIVTREPELDSAKSSAFFAAVIIAAGGASCGGEVGPPTPVHDRGYRSNGGLPTPKPGIEVGTFIARNAS